MSGRLRGRGLREVYGGLLALLGFRFVRTEHYAHLCRLDGMESEFDGILGLIEVDTVFINLGLSTSIACNAYWDVDPSVLSDPCEVLSPFFCLRSVPRTRRKSARSSSRARLSSFKL